MGIIARVGDAFRLVANRDGNPLNNPAIPLGGPGFWAWLLSGEVTEAGEAINDASALQQITVYICVRIIAESVASLPLKVYERLSPGRQEALDNDLYDLLRWQPNPEMTASTFFECLGGCLALTGNCYAQIVRNAVGAVTGIYPLHPHKTQPVRVDQQLFYRTSDGEELGKARLLRPEDVLHVPLFCFDGLLGLSPVAHAKQSIGLSKAAEKYGARFFGNGSRPGGVLSAKLGQKFDDVQLARLKESWTATQGGINQGKTAVLPGEWTYTQIGLSPEESQFLETRKFSRTDICGLFRVPPHMAGDVSRLSNSNHEQQSLQFVTDTLRPYITKLEQEFHRKLIPHKGRNAGHFFVQFDVRERLRGDFTTTMQGYALGRQWGFYSANDILEDLGQNPIGPEGDVYLAPVNMVNLKNLVPGAKPEPASGAVGADPPAGGGDPAPGSAAPAPAAGGAPPAPEAKSLDRYLPAYIGLFRDAVQRFIRRDKRGPADVSLVFGPVMGSLASQIRDLWAAKLGLDAGWDGTAKVIAAELQGMAARSAAWLAEDPDQVAMGELAKAVRSFEFCISGLAELEAAKRKVGTNEA